jgi:hypothetical protein
MVAAVLIFAGNGFYQHRSWWVKGGRETHYMDVDILTQMPAGPAAHHHLGDHYEVCPVWPMDLQPAGIGCGTAAVTYSSDVR